MIMYPEFVQAGLILYIQLYYCACVENIRGHDFCKAIKINFNVVNFLRPMKRFTLNFLVGKKMTSFV